MTIYELIKELVSYPPNTEIMFKCNDETTYDCDIRYKRFLDELHIELE